MREYIRRRQPAKAYLAIVCRKRRQRGAALLTNACRPAIAYSRVGTGRTPSAVPSIRRIAVCFIEWSDPGSQRLVIDWTLIEDLGTAKQFGDQLLELPRSFAHSTSISGGIDFALAQFTRAPFDAKRRTIDVSGDGNNNSGRDVRLARNEAVAAGVTVNGLVILTDARFSWGSEHTNPPGGLEKYYRDNVIGGPGAFVLVAKDFNSFGNLLIRKLMAEIALIGPRGEILPLSGWR